MRHYRLYSLLLLLFISFQIKAQVVLDVEDPEAHRQNEEEQKRSKEQAFDFETQGWKKTLKSAKIEKRNIFVLFLTDNCDACELMKSKILTDIKLAGFYGEKFLLFKPEIGSKEMTELTSKYHVNSFPTIIFVDGYGNLIHKYIGVVSEEDMVNMAENVSSNRNTLKYYKAQYKKLGRRMPTQELYDYSLALMHAGEDNKAIVKAYFKTQCEGELATAENVQMIMLFTNKMYSREFIFFVKNRVSIENSLYTQADYAQKVEDVISSSLIKSMQSNKKIMLNDTLEKTLSFFEIEDQDAIVSRVTMDYYDVVVPDKQKYFEALNNYLIAHSQNLDFNIIAEKVQRVVEECDNKAIENSVLTFVSETIANSSEFNEELYEAYIDLLLKDNRRQEAEDQINIMIDRFSAMGYSEDEVYRKYEYYIQKISNNPNEGPVGEEDLKINQ